MAIKSLTLTCDYCEADDDRFEDVNEAHDAGWLVVHGPDYLLGRDEKVYCSIECLRADL